jgi:hypothetical protein
MVIDGTFPSLLYLGTVWYSPSPVKQFFSFSFIKATSLVKLKLFSKKRLVKQLLGKIT